MWRGIASHVVTLSIGVYLGLEFRDIIERWPLLRDNRRRFTVEISSSRKSQRLAPSLEASFSLPPKL